MDGRGNCFFGLEIEGRRAPSVLRTKKVENKNHFKENLQKIRQLQKINKQQRESHQPVKALWKSSKYENVESKLKKHLESCYGNSYQNESNRSFLRAHSRTGFHSASARGVSPDIIKDSSRTVGRTLTAREGQTVDYIKHNGCAIKHYTKQKSPSLINLSTSKQNITHQPGEMPQYLIERRNQWLREDEDRRKKLKEAEIPAGHRLMTEEERNETLEKARQKHKELLRRLSSLPLRNDTVKLRTVKDELEVKLSEIEEAMKKLSRSKVYVDLRA